MPVGTAYDWAGRWISRWVEGGSLNRRKRSKECVFLSLCRRVYCCRRRKRRRSMMPKVNAFGARWNNPFPSKSGDLGGCARPFLVLTVRVDLPFLVSAAKKKSHVISTTRRPARRLLHRITRSHAHPTTLCLYAVLAASLLSRSRYWDYDELAQIRQWGSIEWWCWRWCGWCGVCGKGESVGRSGIKEQ